MITINGKAYPFKLGRGAIRSFAKQTGRMDAAFLDIGKILTQLSFSELDILNYYCFKSACSSANIDFPFSIEEFSQALSNDPSIVDAIDEAQKEQSPVGKEVGEAEPPLDSTE